MFSFFFFEELQNYVIAKTLSFVPPPFFFNLCGGASGTAATIGLLYQPRMIGEGDCKLVHHYLS
jgi:hypothetical protein